MSIPKFHSTRTRRWNSYICKRHYFTEILILYIYICSATVEPPIKDTIGKYLYKRLVIYLAPNNDFPILLYSDFQPPRRGHLPIKEKISGPKGVLYTEVPLYF